MKKILLILFLVNCLWCFGQKPVIYSRERIEIDSLLVTPPLSRIYVINKMSKMAIDEELSRETFNAANQLIKRQFQGSINATYLLPDSATQAKLNTFITTVCTKISNERQASKYIIPDSIMNLFGSANKGFVFCLATEGFKRGRENLVRTQTTSEVADFLIGYNFRPLESSSLMIGFILDLNQRQIHHFEKNTWPNNDPTDLDVLRLQINRMLTHCLN